ncbi:MAG: FAD/FMN-dependent dehydrogenase, partial [Microbacteriaceae bacterium]|nr:FAD/FMN-dependent dehydrogenase [Microbacteriaceae bacterium]
MTDVKHMKWWGWGREGVAFHWQDKPAFPAFLKMAIGVDLNDEAGTPPGFDDITVPDSRASAAFLATLTGISGSENVTTDDMSRVVHTFGKSIRDLIRVRASMLLRTPDVVVYPADEAEVQAIVAAAVAEDAVIIPFGGGS